MSLHDDFGMYYNNTFIGLQQRDGRIFPLWVESVSNDSDLFNLRNFPSAQRVAAEHGDEAYNAMVFNGTKFNGRGTSSASAAVASENIIFDLPNPKYIKVDNNYYWCSYRANRSTKKGLCDRRFSSTLRLTNKVAYAMFNDEPDENIIGRVFLKNGNKLDYKGVPIGNLEGTAVTLYREAAHLERVLQQEWPECQITLEAAE